MRGVLLSGLLISCLLAANASPIAVPEPHGLYVVQSRAGHVNQLKDKRDEAGYPGGGWKDKRVEAGYPGGGWKDKRVEAGYPGGGWKDKRDEAGYPGAGWKDKRGETE